MSLNTRPKIRRRVRLTLRAQKCAVCNSTLLRGAWVWRDRTVRYTCDGAACRTRRDRSLDLSISSGLRGVVR